MLQKLVLMGFQRSITVDCGEVTVGRRFRNCTVIKKKLNILISRLQKYNPSIYCDESAQISTPNQSNNQKIATVEKGKLNALALEGNCVQSKSAVTTEVIMEAYSCITCIHPQESLQKFLNIFPTQEQTKRTI